MTEAEWLACDNPEEMLLFLGHLLDDDGLTSPAFRRKSSLFGCAYCRRLWRVLGDGPAQGAIDLVERSADGQATWTDRRAAQQDILLAYQAAEDLLEGGGAADPAALEAHLNALRMVNACLVGEEVYELAHAQEAEGNTAAARAVQVGLLRDLFGNPFRAAQAIDPAWLEWNNGTVRRLAEAAYHERKVPGGELDGVRLAVLADALEEAGCADAELLGHLRSPGPHVRGCWAIDLVLAKE